MGRGRYATATCPDCGMQVRAVWSSERLWRHGPDANLCPGSGRRVDLYGSGKAVSR